MTTKILTKEQFRALMDAPSSILYPNDTIRINGNLYGITVEHPEDKVVLEPIEEFEEDESCCQSKQES